MSGALHPALALLLAAGGAPERLAAASDELRARIDSLLSPPTPHLLDDGLLNALIASPDPSELLDEALARLDGEITETAMPEPRAGSADLDREGPAPTRSGVSYPSPADIAAHARAMPWPRIGRAQARQGVAPVAGPPAPAFARMANAPGAGDRPAHVHLASERDWQTKAAQLGADRPLRIAADPPPSSPPAARRNGDGGPAVPETNGAFAVFDSVPDDPARRARGPQSGAAASFGDAPDAVPVARSFRRRLTGAPSSSSATRSAPPVATNPARGAPRDTADARPAISRSRLHAVAMPDGARVGGFAGLALLGRAAPRKDAAAGPVAAAPPRPPGGTVSEAAIPAIDHSPVTDAAVVIAELADTLRSQILAAGIDLSGRRR